MATLNSVEFCYVPVGFLGGDSMTRSLRDVQERGIANPKLKSRNVRE